MIYLIGRYYVELKDKRYSIHPFYDINLQERDASKFLRTQYQVQNILKSEKKQKDIKKTINKNLNCFLIRERLVLFIWKKMFLLKMFKVLVRVCRKYFS